MPIWFVSSTSKDLIDNVSKLAQIVALIIAGYWGYHIYLVTTKPGLEFRGSANGDIDWSEGMDKKTCLGDFHATIRNDGVKSFDVISYKVTAWIYSKSQLAKGQGDASTSSNPVFIDYRKIRALPSYKVLQYPDMEDSDNHGDLLGHYPPGTSNGQSWSWFFSRDDLDQGVLFELVAVTDSGDVTPRSWVADSACPSSKLEGKNDKAKDDKADADKP